MNILKTLGVLMMASLLFSCRSSEVEMSDLKKVQEGVSTEQEMHRHFSVSCFNECWNYIEKEDRTEADDEKMLLLASSSLWHWTQRSDCTPKNLAIGYWQMGRVSCLLNDFDAAKGYGEKGVALAREYDLSPFTLGYAYEVLLNTAVLKGDVSEATRFLALAEEQLEGVTETFDRELLEADLKRHRQSLEALE